MLDTSLMPNLTVYWRLSNTVTADVTASRTTDTAKQQCRPVVAGMDDVPDVIFEQFARGFCEDEMASIAGGEHGAIECYDWLDAFKERGLVVADILCGAKHLMTLVPHLKDFDVPASGKPTSGWRMSRFSYMQHADGVLTLREPDTDCEVIIRDRGLQRHLSDPGLLLDGNADSPIAGALDVLGSLGFLRPAADADDSSADPWEFHDRLFFSQVRPKDAFCKRGPTFRFGNTPYPQPDATDRALSPEIELPRPDVAMSGSFVDILEARRSKRELPASPVDIETVSQLLFHACRNTGPMPETGGRAHRRPYPSAGAIHELSFYLAIRNCNGLQPGFYRYDGQTHTLSRLSLDDTGLASLFEHICASSGSKEAYAAGAVLVSSQLPRLAWKYENLAGKLTLMNAGAALQTLHLVATGIGLGGWIIGDGFPDFFKKATERPERQEIAMASFAFGNAG